MSSVDQQRWVGGERELPLERATVRRLLQILLGTLLLLAVTQWVLGDGELATALVGIAAVCLVSLWLTRRGSAQEALLLIGLGLEAMLLWEMLRGHGIHDTAVPTYVAVCVVGALTLRRDLFLLVVAAAFFSIGLMTWLEMSGAVLTSYTPGTDLGDFAVLAATLGTASWLARWVGTRLDALRRESLQRETRLFQREEELRASEERFEKVFRGSPCPMTLTAPEDGRLLDVNEAFLEIVGASRAELLGRRTDELGFWVDPEGRQQMMAELRRTGSLRNRRTSLRTMSGEARTLLLSGELLEIDRRPHLLLAGIDLTDHERVEQRLRHSQKMEAIGRLAGGIAHDFNNWLTPIVGFSDLIASRLEDDDPLRQDALQILQAGERAALLVQQLLSFSTLRSAQRRSLDPADLLTDLAAMLRRVIDPGIEIRTRFDRAAPEVHADPADLEQIVMNLVLNSRDAMPKGGRLDLATIAVEVARPEEPPFAGYEPPPAPGRYVEIRVRDTGTGIDPAVLPRVFEPFFTTKEPGSGTGLGLYSVYGAVERNEGSLRLESAPGGGTTVSILLPQEPAARAGEGADSDEEPAAVGGHLLVVDDQRAVREFVAAALQERGYAIEQAESGSLALELLERRGVPYDLVVTDISMAEMSGPDFARRAEERHPGSRFLFISGHAPETDGPDAELVRGRFLQKPFSAKELARRVFLALRERR